MPTGETSKPMATSAKRSQAGGVLATKEGSCYTSAFDLSPTAPQGEVAPHPRRRPSRLKRDHGRRSAGSTRERDHACARRAWVTPAATPPRARARICGSRSAERSRPRRAHLRRGGAPSSPTGARRSDPGAPRAARRCLHCGHAPRPHTPARGQFAALAALRHPPTGAVADRCPRESCCVRPRVPAALVDGAARGDEQRTRDPTRSMSVYAPMGRDLPGLVPACFLTGHRPAHQRLSVQKARTTSAPSARPWTAVGSSSRTTVSDRGWELGLPDGAVQPLSCRRRRRRRARSASGTPRPVGRTVSAARRPGARGATASAVRRPRCRGLGSRASRIPMPWAAPPRVLLHGRRSTPSRPRSRLLRRGSPRARPRSRRTDGRGPVVSAARESRRRPRAPA
jgi:hypothetical protein